MKILTSIQFDVTGSMDIPDTDSVTLYVNTNGHLYAELTDGTHFRLTRNRVGT